MGRITEITDPYGNATTYILDDPADPSRKSTRNGNVTQLHYNRLGKHDYRIDPNGYVRPTRRRSRPARPARLRLPETPLEWEFGRRLPSPTIRSLRLRPGGHGVSAAVYNTFLSDELVGNGERCTGRRPGGRHFHRGRAGRPLQATVAGRSERWRYDPNGNLVVHQDRDGKVFRWVYRSFNALQEEIDPLGNVTRYEHTVQGLVCRTTDAGGTVFEYAYDWKDRLVEVRERPGSGELHLRRRG